MDMTVAVQVDESLLQRAEKAMDIRDPAELVHRLLQRAVDLAAAQERLAIAGGTMPDLVVPPRNRQSGE
jgi:Arc/MetJ family transcription regulator